MKFINQSIPLPSIFFSVGIRFSKLNRPWSPFIYFRARSYLPELYFWPTLFFSRFLRRRTTPNLAPPDLDFSRETRPRSSGIKTYEYLTDRAVLNLSYACTPPPPPSRREIASYGTRWSCTGKFTRIFLVPSKAFFANTVNKGHGTRQVSPTGKEATVARRSPIEEGGG